MGSLGVMLAVLGSLVFAALCGLMFLIWRLITERAAEDAARLAASRAFEGEVAELKGRLQSLAEMSVTRQSEFSRDIHERLDRVTHNIGSNLEESSRKTAENLARLNERLAVIDTAQKNLTDLSTRVVSLQDILANKQARGAFGQMRMETIIADGLPKDAFTFQATLSNGKRPDCLIRLPGSDAGIVVDAKFPLEGFELLRGTAQDGARKEALQRIRTDVGKHIADIASKYALPGETQDTMLMFVPSESTYAELHELFPDLLQKAHRARVVIVSPNMLMLAVQTMQAILKDVRMREQASIIQREVGMLMADVHRLNERTVDFQKHFALLGADLDKMKTSAEKIASRGRKIEAMDFDGAPAVSSNLNGKAAELSNGG